MIQGNIKRTLLFPIENGSYFPSMLRLARALSDSENFTIIMYFPIVYPGVEENKRIARFSGFFPVDSDIYNLNPEGMNKGKSSRVKTFLSRYSSLQEIYYFKNEFISLRKLRSNFEALLHDNKVDGLILPAQNRFHSPYFADLAKSNNIPVIIAPDWFAGRYELVESLQGSKFHNLAIPSFILRFMMDKQFIILNPFNPKKRLIPFRISDIILRRYFGIPPDDPWVLHSGYSDVILCESEWAKDFAISLGISSDKLIVTGSIAHDEMFSRAEDEGKSNSAYVVIAIPPDMFPSNKHKDLEFSHFTEMLDFLVDSVKGLPNFEIVASLHPSLEHELATFLSKKGIRIAGNGIHLELANATFFIASISATIQWAMAINIPVINYDLYKFNYPDYVGVPGVVKCENKADFRQNLDILSQTAIENVPQKFSGRPYYGEVDGHAIDRILTLMNSLFQKRALKHD
jgi:hypothetical protein